MRNKTWFARISFTALCLLLGLMLVLQLRTQDNIRQTTPADEWEFIIADLIDSNGRLRADVNNLQVQLEALRDVEGGGAILQSLVDEVNHLRIANGLVVVSGPGIVVEGSCASVKHILEVIGSKEYGELTSRLLAMVDGYGSKILAPTGLVP